MYEQRDTTGSVEHPVALLRSKKADDTLRYVFMGHTYKYNNPGPRYIVDPRIQDFDYTGYSRTWLGGDISSEATLNRGNFVYLDSVFDLMAPTTQYALGNHDIRNGNIQYYREATGRKGPPTKTQTNDETTTTMTTSRHDVITASDTRSSSARPTPQTRRRRRRRPQLRLSSSQQHVA